MVHHSRSGRARVPLRTRPCYVEPQRLIITSHLLQLGKWPMQFLHARSCELNLALLGPPAASSLHHTCQQQSPCPNSPASQQRQLQQQKMHAAAGIQPRPCSKGAKQRPAWDSSIELSRGRTSAPAAVCHRPLPTLQALRQETGLLAARRGSADAATAPFERGTQTQMCLDRQTQTHARSAPTHQTADAYAAASAAPSRPGSSGRGRHATEAQARPAWRPAGCRHTDVETHERKLHSRPCSCKVMDRMPWCCELRQGDMILHPGGPC